MTIALTPIATLLADMPTGQALRNEPRCGCSAQGIERPVFCISQTSLKAQADVFLQGFPGEVSYAVKANSSDRCHRRLA
jgi:diaminopimelate decarboxylase